MGTTPIGPRCAGILRTGRLIRPRASGPLWRRCRSGGPCPPWRPAGHRPLSVAADRWLARSSSATHPIPLRLSLVGGRSVTYEGPPTPRVLLRGGAPEGNLDGRSGVGDG